MAFESIIGEGTGTIRVKEFPIDPFLKIERMFTELYALNYSFNLAYVEKTANYTATENDCIINCDGTFEVTLPDSGLINNTVNKKVFYIKNVGTGTITVNTSESQTIDGDLTVELSQWECLTVVSNGFDWLII